jgi:hypothetical protein
MLEGALADEEGGPKSDSESVARIGIADWIVRAATVILRKPISDSGGGDD